MASFDTTVKGSFYEGRAEVVRKLVDTGDLRVGRVLQAVRMADNPMDTNAIAIFFDPVRQIGFVPKEIAVRLAPLMDAGKECKVIVSDVGVNGYGSPIIGIRIEINSDVEMFGAKPGMNVPAFPGEMPDEPSVRTKDSRPSKGQNELVGTILKSSSGEEYEVLKCIQEFIQVRDSSGHITRKKRAEIGRTLFPADGVLPQTAMASKVAETKKPQVVATTHQQPEVRHSKYSASSTPEELQKGAESGDADAMYWLATCLYYGENGFSIDDKAAEEWLTKAIQLGHIQAQSEAAEWFKTPQELHEMFANI